MKIEIELTEDEYAFLESSAKLQKMKLEALAKSLLSSYIMTMTKAMTLKPDDEQIKRDFRAPFEF